MDLHGRVTHHRGLTFRVDEPAVRGRRDGVPFLDLSDESGVRRPISRRELAARIARRLEQSMRLDAPHALTPRFVSKDHREDCRLIYRMHRLCDLRQKRPDDLPSLVELRGKLRRNAEPVAGDYFMNGRYRLLYFGEQFGPFSRWRCFDTVHSKPCDLLILPSSAASPAMEPVVRSFGEQLKRVIDSNAAVWPRPVTKLRNEGEFARYCVIEVPDGKPA